MRARLAHVQSVTRGSKPVRHSVAVTGPSLLQLPPPTREDTSEHPPPLLLPGWGNAGSVFVKPQTSYCYGTKPYVGNTPVVFGAILEDRELDGNSWRMSSGLPTVEEGHAPPPVISCVLCNPSSTECLGGGSE